MSSAGDTFSRLHVKSQRRVFESDVRRPVCRAPPGKLLPLLLREPQYPRFRGDSCQETMMVKIAKTADRKKVMDTTKSTDCPKCGKPTRIVKRVKDRERNVPGGVFISCSACEFFEKL